MTGVVLVGTSASGDLVPILVNPDGSLAGAGGGGGGGSTDVSALSKEATQASVLTALGAAGTLHTDLANLLSNTNQSFGAPQALAALNAAVTISPGRKGTQMIQVTGTFVGTISLLGNLDSTNYVLMNATPQFLNMNTGAYTATITAPGLYQTSVNGLIQAQLKMTAFTSGSAVVSTSLTDAPAMVALDASIPTGANTIGKVDLGSGTLSSVLGTVRLTDGANSPTVRGASSLPVFGDPALNVTVRDIASTASFGATLAAGVTGAAVARNGGAAITEVDCFNPTAAPVYLKIFNKAGVPTLGTDIPVFTLAVPSGATAVAEFGVYGKRLTSGVGWAVTTGMADSDATAPATAGVKVGGMYL